MYLEVTAFGPLETNQTIAMCEKTRQVVVFDAPPGSHLSLQETLGDLNAQPRGLYLTHSHWDHIADAEVIQKEAGIPIYVHRGDEENLRIPGSDGFLSPNPFPPCEPDDFLEDRQICSFGSEQFEIMHVPGHSPGSICFYFPTHNALKTGDTLLKGGTGPMHPPTVVRDLLVRALKRLGTLPPDTRVYPGHGDVTTIGQEVWLKQPSNYLGG